MWKAWLWKTLCQVEETCFDREWQDYAHEGSTEDLEDGGHVW
jgi:hypothetical protein